MSIILYYSPTPDTGMWYSSRQTQTGDIPTTIIYWDITTLLTRLRRVIFPLPPYTGISQLFSPGSGGWYSHYHHILGYHNSSHQTQTGDIPTTTIYRDITTHLTKLRRVIFPLPPYTGISQLFSPGSGGWYSHYHHIQGYHNFSHQTQTGDIPTTTIYRGITTFLTRLRWVIFPLPQILWYHNYSHQTQVSYIVYQPNLFHTRTMPAAADKVWRILSMHKRDGRYLALFYWMCQVGRQYVHTCWCNYCMYSHQSENLTVTCVVISVHVYSTCLMSSLFCVLTCL